MMICRYHQEKITVEDKGSFDRAGRYLGILVIPPYWNHTIRVLSKQYYRLRYYRLWHYRSFTVFKNSFEARRLVIAIHY